MDFDFKWQGAEAKVGVGSFFGKTVILKERVKKEYRHPELDARLTSKRALQEVRCMMRARKHGIRTPAIYLVDTVEGKFIMEYVDGKTLNQTIRELEAVTSSSSEEGSKSAEILEELARKTGQMLAKLHDIDTVHGDLTTSNLLVTPEGDLVMIDFGLSYGSNLIEDKAVDLYVLERAISSTHPISTPRFFDLVLESYRAALKNPRPVLNKFADVQLRGRKREMIG